MDEDNIHLTQHGVVTVTPDGITVQDFEGRNAMCREVAIMACAWAIGELQREMLKNIEKPGGGKIFVE